MKTGQLSELNIMSGKSGQYTNNSAYKHQLTLKFKKEFKFYIIPTLCNCGCGNVVWYPGSEFKSGHNTKTQYHRNFISELQTGQIRSDNFKQNLHDLNIRLQKSPPQPTDKPAWNWKGGLSFLPYCHKFNKKFKAAVKERDNHTCQLYGTTDKKLAVHHVHYDKENCYPDVITLCNSDNSRVNKNRNIMKNCS